MKNLFVGLLFLGVCASLLAGAVYLTGHVINLIAPSDTTSIVAGLLLLCSGAFLYCLGAAAYYIGEDILSK